MLSLRDVSVVYQQNKGLFKRVSNTAVQNVDLDIRPGETVALVGESGSGKTTLGKAILQLLEPATGEITLAGEAIEDTLEFRRRVQAVFQDPYSSISPYMTVRDIIAEPLVIHGIGDREERVRKALDQVHLESDDATLAKYPHALSGGQRQRVSIARSIVLDPEVVVADEPVSMVDAAHRSDILGVLKEIQDASRTSFLYITHDIASTRDFAHRIAVMYAGSIVEQGTVSEVLNTPLHPYTRALLASVPDVDPENARRLRRAIKGEPPSGVQLPQGCAFHPRCPEAIPGTCDIAVPALRVPDAGHDVACVLYPEQKKGGSEN